MSICSPPSLYQVTNLCRFDRKLMVDQSSKKLMISPKKVSILCRYGGDFVEESNNEVCYKDGTNRIIRLAAQEINYSSLLYKVLEVCRWGRTQIGSIKYKHPEYGFNCLVSVENDEDIDNMMEEFSQNNGPIQLFVFETQKILPIHKTTIASTGKEIAENGQGSKEMPPRPNSTMNINAETTGVPTVGLLLGMENEPAMNNRNLSTNNRSDYGCASDTLLPSIMEPEEGQEMSLQPNAKTADDMLPPLQSRMEIEEGQEMPLQRNSNVGINAEIAGMPAHNLQSRMGREFGTYNHNLSSNGGTEYGCANDNMALLLRPGMELEEGREFRDANALHKFLRQYAINLNFQYKRTRSGNGLFAAKCIKEDCPWRIQALRLSNQSTFKIKSLKGEHTCNNLDKHLKVTSHYQATRKWIADIVEHRNYFQCTPKAIADVIEKEYNIKVSYNKAWRGKELARKRSTSIGNNGQGHGRNYKIEKLCEDIRRTNPGSWINLQSKSTGNDYLKLFISYEAAVIPVFQMVCRPVVQLSCVRTEGKRPFVWLMATGLDTNSERLLLACGFVELDENEEEDLLEDYKWFCRELFHILGQITNLIFMVDYTHEGGVLKVVRSIFPHSHCIYEGSSFAGEMVDKFDTLSLIALSRAMYAFKKCEFEERMIEIQRQSGEAWEFLRNVNPEYWTVSHFKGSLGSDYFGESFLDTWSMRECGYEIDVLIVELVEHLHNLMMETLTERVERSSNCTSILLPQFEAVRFPFDPFSNQEILQSTPTRFTLSSSKNDHSVEVDMHMRNCSCREWQIRGYPCRHAELVIEAFQLNRYEYWDDCYKTAAYEKAYSVAVIHPLRRRLKMRRLVYEMIAFLKLEPELLVFSS